MSTAIEQPHPPASIVTIDDIRMSIQKADSVMETVDIQKRIAVLLDMARIADATFERLYEIGVERLNAMRKGGKIALGLERGLAGRPADNYRTEFGNLSDYQLAIVDSGITERTIQKWQKAARIPDDVYEDYLDDCLEKLVMPTMTGCLRYSDGNYRTVTTGENEWYTPPEYIQLARDVMGGIDLDPASCEEANETVQANTFYTEDDDGLTLPWFGRVWLNPPYSRDLMPQFTQKLKASVHSGDVSQAIMVSHNNTDTRWFQDLSEVCTAICFPGRRIKFYRGNDIAAPVNGQMFMYFGIKPEVFNSVFGSLGLIVRPMNNV